MLGILVIYWVGKQYYELAFRYNKSKWFWTILAIIIYFSSQFLFGLILAFLFPAMFVDLDTGKSFFINVMGVLFGLLAWYIVLKILESAWEKQSYSIIANGETIIDQIGRNDKTIHDDAEEENY